MTLLVVELDHLAVLRQASGGRDPDPAHVATLAELAGAGGISLGLGRGPGGLQERDLRLLREVGRGVLNVCLCPQEEAVRLVLAVRPDLVTLVPEPREPFGPERGLDVEDRKGELARTVETLRGGGIPTAVLVDPLPAQIKAAQRIGAAGVRLHTGRFAWAADPTTRAAEHEALLNGAKVGQRLGLWVHAGGGLAYDTVGAVAQIPEIQGLSVGRALLARALLVGVAEGVRELLRLMREGAAR